MTDETRQSPAETVSHSGIKITAERHPGPFIGPDAELARACAIVTIRDYGNDTPEEHQRIMAGGIWNDHIAVQTALTTIHSIRKAAGEAPIDRATPQQQLDFLAGEVRKALAYFDRMPLPQYFDGVERGDPIALAVLGAFDHLSPALNVLGLTDEPLTAYQRPEGGK